MNAGDLGVVGAVVGVLLGLGGGAVGTYYSIARARGEAGRRFQVRLAIVAWIAVAGFLALLVSVPPSYRVAVMLTYAMGLPLALSYAARRQAELRQVTDD